jgi:hypothetical protein
MTSPSETLLLRQDLFPLRLACSSVPSAPTMKRDGVDQPHRVLDHSIGKLIFGLYD